MIPTYISGCYSILHPAHGRRGVLICGSLSDEALNSYRPLVFLAEQLAAAGMPALRLSYYGTGDSAGGDSETNCFPQWLDSISAGVAWMRAHCGVETVTLIGHRIGANLIARAACDIDAVDSIVLLAQISGRHFLHELMLAARISQRVWQTNHRVDDGTWFESHGLRIDHVTRRDLNALDISKLPKQPAAHALVVDAKDGPAARQAVEGLQRLGTETAFELCEDLDRMQRDSYEAEVPRVAIDRVAAWMQSLPLAPAAPCVPVHVDASLVLGRATETPIHFGPDDALFGVLSTPRAPSRDAPAVLVVSTSANPRWGNSRIGVTIARSLAADGVVSLRMDGAGMGDTAPASGERGRPYSAAATADVLQGVAELVGRTGRTVVILGMCSGAYHALQAGARDRLVGGLVLVNLQRFVWHEGDPSDMVRRSALRPNRFYLRNLLNARAWLRLLRADFDVANLARVFAARLLRRAVAAVDPLLGCVLGGVTRVGRVRQMVQEVSARGSPVLYALGCNDPGIEELAEYFGRDGWRLRRQANVTFRLLQDADHIFGAQSVREELIHEIRNWCRSNWLASESESQPESRSESFQSSPSRKQDGQSMGGLLPQGRTA